jgi:hypothetical protein
VHGSTGLLVLNRQKVGGLCFHADLERIKNRSTSSELSSCILPGSRTVWANIQILTQINPVLIFSFTEIFILFKLCIFSKF